MSVRRRSVLPAAGAVLTAAAVLGSAQSAWAETPSHDQGGHDAAPAAGEHRVGPLGPNSPGDPTAAPEYLTQHLNTYHFGHPLVGFDVAATDLPGWANYHLIPTGLETAARGVAPAKAPEVQGDTWVPTAAPQYQNGTEHSTSHRKGQPLNLPVNPTAGLDYLGKWAKGKPSPAETLPAVQETARRTVTPTEVSPAVKGDERVDRRPGPDSPKPIAIAPPQVNDGAQQLWDEGPGKVAGTALSPITGGSSYGGGEGSHGSHAASSKAENSAADPKGHSGHDSGQDEDSSSPLAGALGKLGN